MPELPLPLPALAGLAGVGGFLGARLLSSPGIPTPDVAANPADAGNAQASDLFASFGGDGFGLGNTGGGTLNGIDPGPYGGGGLPGGNGTPTDTVPPAGPTCNGAEKPPMLGIPGGPWVCTANGWSWQSPTGSAPPPPPPIWTSSAPSSIGKRPAGAIGWVGAHVNQLYTVAGGVATAHPYSGLVFSAWVGPAQHFKPNATVYRILSGAHAGQYVHVTDVSVKR